MHYNTIRADYGLPALVRNSQLDTVAQGFSDSMASTLTYPWNGSHEAGGNKWSGTGGRMKTILGMGFAYPAENIMRVSGTETRFGCDNVPMFVEKTANSIAVYTALSWVEHDGCANNGHRKTVLSDPANYGGTTEYLPTDVGIGIAKGSDGQYYITAEFAHKN
ncbi:MAG: CAP domain-containing protein [Methanospirillum sp.]|nr:CAP domain-containing protein [Methanospirillum sp.]